MVPDVVIFCCRVNTFSPKVHVGKGVFHPVHEYCDTMKNIYHNDFLKSAEFKAFQERTGRETLGFRKFKEGCFMCPCIQQPKMRVCVDETETSFNELTKTLASALRRRPVTAATCCKACESQAAQKLALGNSKYIFACNALAADCVRDGII